MDRAVHVWVVLSGATLKPHLVLPAHGAGLPGRILLHTGAHLHVDQECHLPEDLGHLKHPHPLAEQNAVLN